MNHSVPGLPVHHQLLEFTQTHAHQVGDATQPPHPLSSPSLPAHLVKAMIFPVVMYGCDSWTVKKAECQKIDAFELWCWRRFLRVSWTARRSNQSILKEISPGCSLEGLMLKLKLQYFGHLMRRVDSLEKTLMLGGIQGRRRRGRQRMSLPLLLQYNCGQRAASRGGTPARVWGQGRLPGGGGIRIRDLKDGGFS